MIDRVRNYLATLPPGSVADTARLESLLAECWAAVAGNVGGMKSHKLFGSSSTPGPIRDSVLHRPSRAK
jgi:hypothetical protein